jgi:hypothetical protein
LNKTINIILVGTGGYGEYYLRTLLDEFPNGAVKVVGVVDPFCTKTPLYEEMKNFVETKEGIILPKTLAP